MTAADRRRRSAPLAGVLDDARGAVMSEYVVLVGTVGVVVGAAIAALGPSLLASYYRARGILLVPMP